MWRTCKIMAHLEKYGVCRRCVARLEKYGKNVGHLEKRDTIGTIRKNAVLLCGTIGKMWRNPK